MNKKESLKIDVKRRRINAELHAVAFMDGEYHIIYIPSLNLSAYGDTPEEAKEMMNESLKVFSEDLLECSSAELDNMLADLGWQKEKFFPKKRVNLSQTTFEDIKKQFNLPDATKSEEFEIAI